MNVLVWSSNKTTKWRVPHKRLTNPKKQEKSNPRSAQWSLLFSTFNVLCIMNLCLPHAQKFNQTYTIKFLWGSEKGPFVYDPEIVDSSRLNKTLGSLQDNISNHTHLLWINIWPKRAFSLYPPYSVDFGSCDYFLLQTIKDQLWGCHFGDHSKDCDGPTKCIDSWRLPALFRSMGTAVCVASLGNLLAFYLSQHTEKCVFLQGVIYR